MGVHCDLNTFGGANSYGTNSFAIVSSISATLNCSESVKFPMDLPQPWDGPITGSNMTFLFGPDVISALSITSDSPYICYNS